MKRVALGEFNPLRRDKTAAFLLAPLTFAVRARTHVFGLFSRCLGAPTKRPALSVSSAEIRSPPPYRPKTLELSVFWLTTENLVNRGLRSGARSGLELRIEMYVAARVAAADLTLPTTGRAKNARRRGPSEATPMRAFDDPSDLTPRQRLHELAALLAEGLARLETRPPESPAAILELPAESRPDRAVG